MITNAVTADKIKSLGQAWTPQVIADTLAKWAIRSPDDRVFIPGFGKGAFIKAAIRRYAELGVEPKVALKTRIYAVEIDKEVCSEVRGLYNARFGGYGNLMCIDFFDVRPGKDVPLVNAIIGNPPFIRFHLFNNDRRKKAFRALSRAGISISARASSWAYFVAYVTLFLKPKSRLALVLPSTLMSTQYAQEIRTLLARTFNSATLIVFQKRVLDNVLEDIVLLLATRDEDKSKSYNCLIHVITVDDMNTLWRAIGNNTLNTPHIFNRSDNNTKLDINIHVYDIMRKWNYLLIPSPLRDNVLKILRKVRTISLKSYAHVKIGIVTGANDFFIISPSKARKMRLDDKLLVPIVCRSRWLRGLVFTKTDFKELVSRDARCYLLRIDNSEVIRQNKLLSEYLELGEKLGISKRYKAKTRSPWYKIGLQQPPHAFLTYMCYHIPRLVINEAKVYSTNAIHNVYLTKTVDLSLNALFASFYNTLTMLYAELLGRHYGGGVLKLEPNEAMKLPLPMLDDHSAKELMMKFNRIDELLRNGEYYKAISLVDEILLLGQEGLSISEYNALKQSYNYVKNIRMKK